MSSASDVSQAQATFLGTVVSKFTPEAFHTLRRYLGTTSDVASVTNLLLRAQKFTDAGAAMAIRALGESDMREKQGILAVRVISFDLSLHCRSVANILTYFCSTGGISGFRARERHYIIQVVYGRLFRTSKGPGSCENKVRICRCCSGRNICYWYYCLCDTIRRYECSGTTPSLG